MKSRAYPIIQETPAWTGDGLGQNAELARIRRSVELVGRLSDGLIRIGPWGIGIDGVLNLIPVAGEVYSALAGGFILVQGVRARVPFRILLGCAALLISRMAFDAVPLGGPIVADLFIAHKWSARLVTRAIDRKLARGR